MAREIWWVTGGFVRAVWRRCAAAGERDEFRAGTTPNVRAEELAVRPLVRRRLSGHVEFAGLAERRLRTYAARTARHPRFFRASRVADDDDRGERGRVGPGETGHARCARAGHRAR